MFKTVADINLDHLKKNHTRLYYFGLGFIQLKINETWRLHFYSKELPKITEDVHNHRYDFQSTILAGSIANHSFQVNEGNSYRLIDVSCDPKNPPSGSHTLCGMEPHHSRTMTAGWSYGMAHTEFHRVTSDDGITLLKRSGYKKDFAHIIVPVGQDPICPFSHKIEEDKLWQIIDKLLIKHK